MEIVCTEKTTKKKLLAFLKANKGKVIELDAQHPFWGRQTFVDTLNEHGMEHSKRRVMDFMIYGIKVV